MHEQDSGYLVHKIIVQNITLAFSTSLKFVHAITTGLQGQNKCTDRRRYVFAQIYTPHHLVQL